LTGQKQANGLLFVFDIFGVHLMFSINPVTGTVNTTKILDRELIPIHYFQVIATDNGHPKRNDFSLLSISVLDVNDIEFGFIII
jgi:hypothetical protein